MERWRGAESYDHGSGVEHNLYGQFDYAIQSDYLGQPIRSRDGKSVGDELVQQRADGLCISDSRHRLQLFELDGRSDRVDQFDVVDHERAEECDGQFQPGNGFVYGSNGSIGASGYGGWVELYGASGF